MKDIRKFSEDKQIIGTPRYAYFQQMCSEAGLFAIKEAKDRGLPITYIKNREDLHNISIPLSLTENCIYLTLLKDFIIRIVKMMLYAIFSETSQKMEN